MEKTLENQIRELLAGYNCGACGRCNCDEMAKCILNGEDTPDNCLPIDEDNIEKIKELLKK